jgi:hypothetical protein
VWICGWVILCFGVGCGSLPRVIPTDTTQKIVVGTRRADVESQLGRPRSERTGASGQTVAVYEFCSIKPDATRRAGAVECRYFSVLYDPTNAVQKTLVFDSRREIHTVPQVDLTLGGVVRRVDRVGVLLDRQDVMARVKPGMKRTELLAALPPATSETLEVNGGTILTWVAGQPDRQGFPSADVQTLRVLLDDDGEVLDFDFSGETGVRPKSP